MDTIIVEYSKSQKAFHRTTVQERLVNLHKCNERNFVSDYEPVATFLTVQEADDFILRCHSQPNLPLINE